MSDYIGNSNASKRLAAEASSQQDKKIEPVTANVTVKKETAVKKFGRKLISEDAKSVGSHVLDNVIVPSIQKLLVDSVKNAVDWLIYGKRGTTTNSGIRGISYSSYFDKNRQTQQSPAPISRPSIYSVNEVIFDDRGEAEEVLLRMREAIDKYSMVSVGDFYEMICQKSEFTSQKYGWRDLKDAVVVRRGAGYAINFPKIEPLS